VNQTNCVATTIYRSGTSYYYENSLEVVMIGGETNLPVVGHRRLGHVRPTSRPVTVQDRGATERHQSVL